MNHLGQVYQSTSLFPACRYSRSPDQSFAILSCFSGMGYSRIFCPRRTLDPYDKLQGSHPSTRSLRYLSISPLTPPQRRCLPEVPQHFPLKPLWRHVLHAVPQSSAEAHSGRPQCLPPKALPMVPLPEVPVCPAEVPPGPSEVPRLSC